MKSLIVLVCALFSFSSFSHDSDKGKHKGHDKHHHEPSIFEVIPLNSPVKESLAKFLLKTPTGFEIDKIKYAIRNANNLKVKDKEFQDAKLSGNELSVPVSKLPPGFYQLFVKVIDKKKIEHDFKTKYKDHAMFVIDDTLEVADPGEAGKLTVDGIDSDNNGIRDDIQRFINQNYGSDLKTKLALKQYATTSQLRLTTINDKPLNVEATHSNLDASTCASGALGKSISWPLIDKLNTKFLNTKERLMADKKASINFSGQEMTIPNDKSILCQFQIP